jgi:hypothetical protein
MTSLFSIFASNHSPVVILNAVKDLVSRQYSNQPVTRLLSEFATAISIYMKDVWRFRQETPESLRQQ